MKTISIDQANNGFSVNVYTKGAEAHPVDFISETFVFHNTKDVLEFIAETLKEVPEVAA